MKRRTSPLPLGAETRGPRSALRLVREDAFVENTEPRSVATCSRDVSDLWELWGDWETGDSDLAYGSAGDRPLSLLPNRDGKPGITVVSHEEE